MTDINSLKRTIKKVIDTYYALNLMRSHFDLIKEAEEEYRNDIEEDCDAFDEASAIIDELENIYDHLSDAMETTVYLLTLFENRKNSCSETDTK